MLGCRRPGLVPCSNWETRGSQRERGRAKNLGFLGFPGAQYLPRQGSLLVQPPTTTLRLKPHRFSVASWTPPKGPGAKEGGTDHFLGLQGANWLVRLPGGLDPGTCLGCSLFLGPSPCLWLSSSPESGWDVPTPSVGTLEASGPRSPGIFGAPLTDKQGD